MLFWRIRFHGLWQCLVLFLLTAACAFAEIEGKYLAVKKTESGGEKTMALDIFPDEDGRLTIEGTASSGSVAPDILNARLREDEGKYWFVFSDSFGNSGVAWVQEVKEGLKLWILVTDCHEPRPMRCYGEYTLKRVKE